MITAMTRYPGSVQVTPKIASDTPEDANKSDGGEQRGEQSETEINGRVSRHPCVLGNSVLGVSMFSPHEFETAVTTIRQPVIDHVFAQPLAPFALNGHPAPDRKNSKHSASSGKRQKNQRFCQQRRSILLLKC